MRLPQTEILKRAENLASALASGPTRVERNVLLAVVADFMSDSQPNRQKLYHTLELLGAGSGGHLKRGGTYASQIKTVVAELRRLLDTETLESDDYRSLFGWTARLLLVRGLKPEPHSPRPVQPPPAALPKAGRRQHSPETPGAPPRLGALDSQGLSSLQKLKQALEESERKKKR
ncbi:MAG: hypothetical protein M3O15_00675 [Acidobacteriota bacterium]|nr:hypothetical protein [Acidobacteriota bacterium]